MDAFMVYLHTNFYSLSNNGPVIITTKPKYKYEIQLERHIVVLEFVWKLFWPKLIILQSFLHYFRVGMTSSGVMC
jgi:hypothetical protein